MFNKTHDLVSIVTFLHEQGLTPFDLEKLCHTIPNQMVWYAPYCIDSVPVCGTGGIPILSIPNRSNTDTVTDWHQYWTQYRK